MTLPRVKAELVTKCFDLNEMKAALCFDPQISEAQSKPTHFSREEQQTNNKQ